MPMPLACSLLRRKLSRSDLRLIGMLASFDKSHNDDLLLKRLVNHTLSKDANNMSQDVVSFQTDVGL